MPRAAAAGVALALAGALLVPAPALATVPDGPDNVPEPTSNQLGDSVQVFSDLAGSVRQWKLGDSVSSVESKTTDGGETTITLSTDILFTPDSSKLPRTAAARIAKLVAKVPQKAHVAVAGHTDSFQGKVDNQKLSEARARAVAAVLKGKRADLLLQVKGYAATRPAVPEDPKDPSTFAKNRRVEITYSR
ncbi:OmpA family protein [Arthrobacter sp.]|uniref:OmpA family protein n=1 Tax=Arthrobacter sp. TaxID=1667 RepID=UPI003A8F4D7D